MIKTHTHKHTEREVWKAETFRSTLCNSHTSTGRRCKLWAGVTYYFRDVFHYCCCQCSVTCWLVLGASRQRLRRGNIMASGTGEPSTGHDAELDELLDSKNWHLVVQHLPPSVCLVATQTTPLSVSEHCARVCSSTPAFVPNIGEVGRNC